MPGIKTLRIAYIVVAALIMLCAIVAAFFHNIYLAAGLIILDSIIIFLGSILTTRKLTGEELEKLKKE